MSPPATLVGRLIHHAEQHPRGTAVASSRVLLTYAELAECVEAQADRLRDAGVSNTSVVGIQCGDDVKHLILCLAATRLGATSFTLPSFESAGERERARASAGVTQVLGEDLGLDPVAAARPRSGADPRPSAAPGAELLFSTSGTTAEPKIVRHRDAGLVEQAHRHIGAAESRFACLATMEHNFAKRHRLYCVAEGATNVFLEPKPDSLVRQCQELGVTALHVSAFQAQELLAEPGIGELRPMRLKLGGSHVTAELRRRLHEGVTEDLCFGYGTTETGAIAFTDPRDGAAGESVGRALPGIEIRVSDESGGPVPAGERGEVAIRCAGMFLGYLGRPEATAARLVDGWFHTGDVGRLDEEGRLHLCGRSDDMFVFNSVNVHPQDVESEIRQHPSVVDVAVLPWPSPVHGDVPVALVVLDGTAPPDVRDLKRFVRSRVGLRTPRRFTVVDRIPRNAAGKILRSEARALLGMEASP